MAQKLEKSASESAQELIPAHERIDGQPSARILSGGDAGECTPNTIRTFQRDAFSNLIRAPAPHVRIAHLLKTGKPLRN